MSRCRTACWRSTPSRRWSWPSSSFLPRSSPSTNSDTSFRRGDVSEDIFIDYFWFVFKTTILGAICNEISVNFSLYFVINRSKLKATRQQGMQTLAWNTHEAAFPILLYINLIFIISSLPFMDIFVFDGNKCDICRKAVLSQQVRGGSSRRRNRQKLEGC